ncbi:MAG: hypothetical protein ABDI07_07790 [Candidatus Kryptonium sp.]
MLLKLVVILTIVAFNFAFTQSREEKSTAPTPGETKSEVPELREYHKVIHKLWHVMWAEKNIKGIAQMYNDIESGAISVKNAKLPGILRDKEEMWNENVNSLMRIVGELKEAIKSNDSLMILKKTEELHSQYEKLVKIIKPKIRELDEFHQVLYVLYHYYVPEYNVEAIRSVLPSLREKMEKLKASKLPGNLKAKEDDFKKRLNELDKAVDDFVKLFNGKFDEKIVKEKMEALHSRYKLVEKLVE